MSASVLSKHAPFGQRFCARVISGFAAELALFLIVFSTPPRARAAASQQRVSARMILATDAVHPASAARAAVVAQIAPGYHINAHIPSLDYLIPTELKFGSAKQFDVTGIFYPKGRVQKLEFAPQGLSVYEGRLVIPALLKIAPGVDPGNYTLQGRLSFQACNETSCFPPATVTFALPVRVVSEAVRLRPVNADVFGKSR